MTEEAQVIQADRDAAAELHLLRYGDPHPYGDILCGELDDGDFVQAFARHRIAAEREVTERAAKLADARATEHLQRSKMAQHERGAERFADQAFAEMNLAEALRRNEHMEG